MRTGWLRSYWLEATEALPWTGRGDGRRWSVRATGPRSPRLCGPSCHSIVRHAGTRRTAPDPSWTSRGSGLRSRGRLRLRVLGGLLRLLLEGPDLGQRGRAGDVGDRAAGTVL